MRILRSSFVLVSLMAAGCRPDAAPLGPADPTPATPTRSMNLSCRVDVCGGTLTCEPAAPSGAGAARALIVGGQNQYVTLASANTAYDALAGELTSDVTVKNLLAQRLGTGDGVTPDSTGVRVFFLAGPSTTAGTGTVTVQADGTDAFTGSSQPYYQYAGTDLGPDGMLSQNETSAPRAWAFAVPPTVTAFEFQVAVSAAVPLPDGWIDVSPATDSVAVGGHLLFTPTIYVAVGREDLLAVAWWSSSDTTIARVDSATGQVLGVAVGTATVTAHRGAAVGSATVHVFAGAEPQFTSISTYDQSCALAPGGIAFCWGSNRYGQLGTGVIDTIAPGATPQAVVGGHVFRQVIASIEASCGLDTEGRVWCWGSNRNGQLGGASASETCSQPNLPSFPCSSTPVPIETAERFSSISSESLGLQMCAIAVNGAAWCWGPNWHAQLGNGSHAPGDTAVAPVKVGGGHTFTKVAVGSQTTCALEADGTPWCWGYHYQAYAGTSSVACAVIPSDTTSRCDVLPVLLKGGHRFRDIALGSASACGVDLDGVAWCWGRNIWGQMGTGGTSDTEVSAPVAVNTALRFVSIDTHAMGTCAVAVDGRGYCWGSNQRGEIGDGTTFQRYLPRLVSGGHTWIRISTGNQFSCGVATDGHAYCWGDGTGGHLGNGLTGLNNPTPVAVSNHP